MDAAQLDGQDKSDGLPKKARYWAVTAIWLALLMAVVDSSIANVALPTIAKDLRAPAVESIWIVNAYQLAIVISLLPLAALGEIVTFRRIFLAGLALFVLASVACCFARSVPELALARAVQGFGAAGVMSVNGALVRYIYPAAQLGRGVGLNALVISIASVIGPTLASAILAVSSWPWLFAVNVPTGLAALAVGIVALPGSPKSGGRLDLISTLLNIAAYGLIIAGLDLLTRGTGYLLAALLIAVGVFAGWWLVRRSLPQARPLVPIDLLRSRLIALTVATSVASFTAQMLAFVALPFFFQTAMHHTQVQTGLLMTAWPLAVGVAAPIAGRLADRYPAAVLGGFGLAMLATGLLLLAMLPAGAPQAAILWRMALCGCGFGFFQAPNNRTLLGSAPKSRAGAAGGMLASARLTGQTAGAAFAALLFGLTLHGPVFSLWLGAAIAAAGCVVSLSRFTAKQAARAG
jgi:DHA2 family multidrug resistance protein-like MFS transporter